MDVVYILGTGSEANDEEIKISARSLCRHMQDLGAVYVVGAYPKHLPKAVHYEFGDKYPEGWKNTYHKVLKACSIEELGDEFLMMNDDFFLTEDFVGADYPFYSLEGVDGGTCGAKSFQVHAPMRINKEMFCQLPFDVNDNACKSWRSFYANLYQAPAVPVVDPIVRTGANVTDFAIQTMELPFFSCSNSSFNDPDFRAWLNGQYPEACPLEIA